MWFEKKCETGWICARVPAGPGEIVGKGGVLPAGTISSLQAQQLPGSTLPSLWLG